jgi:hypothetical protein
LDLGLFVDAEHDRPFRRVVIEPDDVDDLLDEQGVGGELEGVLEVWFEPEPRQIRPTVERLNPERFAIEARDQCVASWGVCSSVATITCSTCSIVTDGGRPGRSSSTSPSRRCFTNLVRHLVTVVGCTRRSVAICLLGTPSAQASTILQRCANACEDFARCAHRCSWSRSCSVNTTTAGGRPVRATHTA